jgi:hypothetical protein
MADTQAFDGCARYTDTFLAKPLVGVPGAFYWLQSFKRP